MQQAYLDNTAIFQGQLFKNAKRNNQYRYNTDFELKSN